MCLAIPGKIVHLADSSGIRMAKVDFAGITREACVEYLPVVEIGDFVLVHVGFAISKMNKEEAERTYRYLSEMDQLDEIRTPEDPPA